MIRHLLEVVRYFTVTYLSLRNSTNGAAACAGATGNANALIDNEHSAILRNSANRACTCTCATAYTTITNYKCHEINPPYV